jgi:agmatinase
MNLFGTKEYNYEDCDVVVVPYGIESNVSWGGGTKNGPQAILRASQEVELHPYPDDLKIHTMTEPKDLSQTVKQAKEDNKFVFILGGDHSLTSHAYQHYNTDIVQFDAHCDLRDSYEGNSQSHACAMRRCVELNEDTELYSFGIRNMSRSEDEYINQNNHRIHRNRLPKGKELYLTFDVDALDVSIMPATGTPEPGGLLWEETIELIKTICYQNRIVAVDVVEFAPIENIPAYDFVVAKLCYHILNESFKQQKVKLWKR